MPYSRLSLTFLLWLCLSLSPTHIKAESSQRPLLKDFLGLNGHYDFKPELYKDVCRLVRNYQNMNWDVKKPGDKITFPVCVNKVNWHSLYGKWQKHGFEVDACAQFSSFGRGSKGYENLWKNKDKWTEAYGYQMARSLSQRGLVTSIEIGNEPGMEFNDKLYQKIFINMAKGIRRGSKQMKIVTATAHGRAADKYSKSLSESFNTPEIKKLYDVINLHVYAIKSRKNMPKGQSPWDRSYPEDPKLDYLKIVDEAIAWRNKHAKDKEIWITEFGYDACTDQAMKKRTGWFKKLNWKDVTDVQQAQYNVRSFLCFAARDIDRAYLYFYNDSDKPSVHAASGLTRNFKPKPAFWAMKQLYELLGDYRFQKVVTEKPGDRYIHAYQHRNGKKTAWVIWSPTGNGRKQKITLNDLPGTVNNVQEMTTKSMSSKLNWNAQGKTLSFTLSESPVYVFFK